MRTLVGKTVTITAKAIQGPRQAACPRTRYKVKDYPADMLFEGAFGERHTRDSSADPVKIAFPLAALPPPPLLEPPVPEDVAEEVEVVEVAAAVVTGSAPRSRRDTACGLMQNDPRWSRPAPTTMTREQPSS